MPAVKTKAVSRKVSQGLKIKTKVHGYTVEKTGRVSEGRREVIIFEHTRSPERKERKKGGKVEILDFTDKIKKITAKIGQQLKSQLPEIDPKRGPQIIGFDVVVDEESIRVVVPKISRAATKSVARAEPVEFDPYAAGRKVVQEMQGAEGGAWTGAELLAAFGFNVGKSSQAAKRISNRRLAGREESIPLSEVAVQSCRGLAPWRAGGAANFQQFR